MSWVMEPAWGAKVGRVSLFCSLRGVEGWLRMQRGVGSSFLGCLVGQRKTKLVPPCAPRHSMNQKHEDRPRLEERLDYNARRDPDTLGAVPQASEGAHVRPGLQPAPHPSVFLIL